MAQYQARVATCVPLFSGPSGDTETVSSKTHCLMADGTYGDFAFRSVYLSDEPITGGQGGSVNVSADIFVGAALVLCLAVGWIAGGQR